MSVVEPRSVPAHAAPSQQSVLALSWLNFFLSGMQTAFGPIVAAYLVVQGWRAEDIGFALSIGGRVRCLAASSWIACGRNACWWRLVVAVALSVLILRLWSSFPLVALAEVLQGITGGVLGPAVVAISLALVGPAGLSERLGQNQRFAAAAPDGTESGLKLPLLRFQQPSCERTSMCGVVDCCTLCIDMNRSRESCTS